MKNFIALAAAVAATASISAYAGDHGGRGDFMKKADANGDGLISRDEAKASPRLAKNFDAIDANKDGQISPDEMRAFQAQRAAEHFKKMDTNGDGMISKAEAANSPRLAEHFDQLDANKDGQLSKDELAAARPAHARK